MRREGRSPGAWLAMGRTWPVWLAALAARLRRAGGRATRPDAWLLATPSAVWSWGASSNHPAARPTDASREPPELKRWADVGEALHGLAGARLQLALSSRLLHTEFEDEAAQPPMATAPAQRLAAARQRLVHRHGNMAQHWPLAQSSVGLPDRAGMRRHVVVAWHGVAAGVPPGHDASAQWAWLQAQARRHRVHVLGVQPWWAHWLAHEPGLDAAPGRWLWVERAAAAGAPGTVGSVGTVGTVDRTLHLTELRFDAFGLAAVQQRRAAILPHESGLAALHRHLAREAGANGGDAATWPTRIGGCGLDGHAAFDESSLCLAAVLEAPQPPAPDAARVAADGDASGPAPATRSSMGASARSGRVLST